MIKILKDLDLIGIDELKPYLNNPKIHNDYQIKKIIESIEEFGFSVPVIVDGDNNLITGHGRYEAAKEMGLKKIPCIRREDLTEIEARAFRIIDNRVSESGWNLDLLVKEINSLVIDDIDLKLTGFEDKEIENLLEVVGIEIKKGDNREENIVECPECGFSWNLNEPVIYRGAEE